jgi:hypothetical protein
MWEQPAQSRSDESASAARMERVAHGCETAALCAAICTALALHETGHVVAAIALLLLVGLQWAAHTARLRSIRR